MDRRPVRSSLLRSAGYDHDTRTLEIEFHDRDVYQYFDFPEFLYQGLLVTASKGTFFNSRIAGRFKHQRVLAGNDR